jgi:phenylacetate-CoA ligase
VQERPAANRFGAPEAPWSRFQGDVRAVRGASPGHPTRAGTHPLETIIAAAAEHPFYAGRVTAGARLEELPVLTKPELYQRIEALLSNQGPLGRVYWSPSGGSGGKALYFPTDVAENRYARTEFARRLKHAGVFGPDQVCLNLNATGHLYRTLELFNDFGERCGATMLPAGNQIDSESMLEYLERFKVNALAGAPTMVIEVANSLAKSGRRIAIDSVITGADMLYAAQRDFIRQHTGARTFAELFGSAECGVWAYKPPSLEGSSAFVVDPKLVHVEILDPDQDGNGRIVVTNLARLTHPLVRYDTGDVGRLESRVVDGRTEQVLEFAGRHQRSFQLDADYIELDDIDRALGGRALKYQVIIDRARGSQRELAELRLVAAGLDRADAEALRARVLDVCPFDKIRFVDLSDLETQPRSGKIPAIVDRRIEGGLR